MENLPKADVVLSWGEARFAGAGVDFNILMQLKNEIHDWRDWCRIWSEKAADLESFGDEAMARGHSITAGESWASAALLYHFGGMYYINDMDQFHESHRKVLSSFAKAAPHVDPPVERFEALFNGVKLPCLLRLPPGVEKPPVVIFCNGRQGRKEETFARTDRYLARGMATLSWDGPGQGETLEYLPMTGDSGPPVAAIIDHLEKRDDVDAGRVGATGPNRGGFAAVKAAAYDPRIKALAVASPGYDRRSVKWDDPYDVAFTKFLFHLKTDEELRQRMMDQTDFTLEGQAGNIRCPSLIVAGGRDEGTQYKGSERLYNEIQGPKEWVVFPDAERNGNNVPFKVRPRIADFLADHLGGKTGSGR